MLFLNLGVSIFGIPIFWGAVSGVPIFLWCPFFGIPIFCGAHFLGFPFFEVPIFGIPIFGVPIFRIPIFGVPHLLADGPGAAEGEGPDAPLAQIFPFSALGENLKFPTFGLVQVVAKLGLERGGRI